MGDDGFGIFNVLLTILAGGMFGVILGKFLDSAPDWVFWAVLVVFFGLTGFLLSISQ